MPFYVSNNPTTPSLVALSFNVLEAVNKDGTIIKQPGPRQISIHEFMIEKVNEET